MEKHEVNLEDAIIIGDLSKMYKISKRTLRLYHEMELLVPYYVDAQTGYRYYSPSQLPRLDMIIQMKGAGLSLKQIKQMMNTKDLSLFEAVLGEQIDKLNEKITEFKVFRNSLTKKLESCKYMQNLPALDTISVEYISRRRAFICSIDPYDLQTKYTESPWKAALEQVKDIFIKNNVPLALFHQVGGIVSKEALLHNQFTCSGACVLLDEEHQYGLPSSPIVSGTYVCIYHKYLAMDNIKESEGIQQLLNYIADNDYLIAGPYLGEVVAETAIFDYNDNNILLKQQIPIKLCP